MNIRSLQIRFFSLALAALLCAISLGQRSTSYGQSGLKSYGQSGFKVDLGIAEVMQALRAWWQDIVVRSDRINDDETRKSAHTVAMAYLEMAGLMEAFSNELEYVYSPECFHHGDCGDAAANLEILVDDMQATMDKIRYAIDRLDAQWAIANMEVSTHLFSNVARRGLVVNAANTLVIGMKNQWPEGMQRHEVSEEEARAIIQKLRGLAEEARAIASEIAMSLNE